MSGVNLGSEIGGREGCDFVWYPEGSSAAMDLKICLRSASVTGTSMSAGRVSVDRNEVVSIDLQGKESKDSIIRGIPREVTKGLRRFRDVSNVEFTLFLSFRSFDF
jgi:hypothetical protein